jgi:hypothetical protein
MGREHPVIILDIQCAEVDGCKVAPREEKWLRSRLLQLALYSSGAKHGDDPEES